MCVDKVGSCATTAMRALRTGSTGDDPRPIANKRIEDAAHQARVTTPAGHVAGATAAALLNVQIG